MKINNIFKYSQPAPSLKPYIYITPSIGTVRKCLLVLLIPQLVMLGVTHTYSALFVILAAVLASIGAEVLSLLYQKEKGIEIMSPLVQGIITGMLFPQTFSPVVAFIITLCVMTLGKYFFGGFASSWITVPALTIVTAYVLNVNAFPAIPLGLEDVQSRNAALILIQNGSIPMLEVDPAITGFFNKTVFRLFGIVVPDGYVSLLWDNGSLIPAFRFNFITLISSIILISSDMVDFVIPFIFIVLYSLLVRFLGPLVVHGVPMQGDMILALMTSGTLFSSLYLLQWYGTVPISRTGKCVYAVIAAILAFLIMGYGMSSVGYVCVILMMNVISTVIQGIESQKVRKNIETVLVPRISSFQEAGNV
ncbi:MAG: RnfABCDGE type electron transport complex subunit D [Treponema sp.]|nr:RnfABCDGE type electron transport complex subunit D [Treponema sp.]